MFSVVVKSKKSCMNITNMDIVERLQEFIENEMRSCSMDFGCITPEYVYRMWGGTVAIEEIANAMNNLKTLQPNGR